MSISEVAPALVEAALTLVPVPGLAFAFSALKAIWDIVQTIKGYRSQMTELATYIAHLLCALNEKYSIKMDLECSTLDALHSLSKLLDDIKTKFEKYTHYRTMVKFWVMKTDVPGMVADYRRKISGLMDILKITALIDNQTLQIRHERARTLDHQQLVSEIGALKDNQKLMVDVLTEERASYKNAEVTVDALETRIKENKDSSLDRQLSISLLKCLNEKFPEQKSSLPFESPPAYVPTRQPPAHAYPTPAAPTYKKHDINHDVWAGCNKARNEETQHTQDTKQFLNGGYFVAEPGHISEMKGMEDSSPPSIPIAFPQPFYGCALAFNASPLPQADAAHHYVPWRRHGYNEYAGY